MAELRLKCEKTDADQQRAQNTHKQELSKAKTVIAEMWSLVELLPNVNSAPPSLGPKQVIRTTDYSLSSDLQKLLDRLSSGVKGYCDMGMDKLTSQLRDLDSSKQSLLSKVSECEALNAKLKTDYSQELSELKRRNDILQTELDCLKVHAYILSMSVCVSL